MATAREINWAGVYPATTTPLLPDGNVDLVGVEAHGRWLIDNGCHGLIPLGSLGEGATLTFKEKVAIVKASREAAGEHPVIPAISALSTQDAVRLTQALEQAGADGFMVLPPYAYSTDWREMKAHIVAVLQATNLPCMLYNNPVAYKTDFTPEQVAELVSEHANLKAIKESSTDVRRIAGIRALVGDRIKILLGVDDAIVEGLRMGAVGWVAGLVNAFPVESVAIWRYEREGRHQEADALYRWFLPLLRLDTVPKFIQLIKLTQAMVQNNDAWIKVRGPRLELVGEELAAAQAVINEGIQARPVLT